MLLSVFGRKSCGPAVYCPSPTAPFGMNTMSEAFNSGGGRCPLKMSKYTLYKSVAPTAPHDAHALYGIPSGPGEEGGARSTMSVNWPNEIGPRRPRSPHCGQC